MLPVDKTDILRIRPKDAKVEKLEFTKEQLAAVEKAKVKQFWSKTLRLQINKILGMISVCCYCHDVPQYKISYIRQGVTVIEYYCESCLRTVYEREEPADPYHGCTKVDCIPATVYDGYY